MSMRKLKNEMDDLDKEFRVLNGMLIALAVAVVLVIVLGIAAALSNKSGEVAPTCPRGYVPTYIYHSGWACTVAPVTP